MVVDKLPRAQHLRRGRREARSLEVLEDLDVRGGWSSRRAARVFSIRDSRVLIPVDFSGLPTPTRIA